MPMKHRTEARACPDGFTMWPDAPTCNRTSMAIGSSSELRHATTCNSAGQVGQPEYPKSHQRRNNLTLPSLCPLGSRRHALRQPCRLTNEALMNIVLTNDLENEAIAL